ncbi:MAG: AraC family transcriptional regulator [Planctomycetota bacterium]
MSGISVLSLWEGVTLGRTRSLLPPRLAVPLYAMVASVGRERRRGPGYDWDGRRRGPSPFALIQHTFDGRGKLIYERQTREVTAGQTMLLTFPHDHRYTTWPGQAWDFGYLVLHGREVMRLMKSLVAAQGPVVRLSEHALSELAAVSIELLMETQANEASMAGHVSALAYRAVTALLDDLVGPASSSVENAPSWLQPVMNRIETGEPDGTPCRLTVNELARLAGLSRWHFTRQFDRHVGSPPAAYLLRRRLDYAAQQLHSTDRAIKAIAIDAGFPDPSYFAKVFARHFKVSPSAFRGTGMYRQ